MKYLKKCLIVVLFGAVTAWFPCQSYAENIFGFKRGMSVAEVKALGLSSSVSQVGANGWVIIKPQKPTGASHILLILTPDKGLLKLIFMWQIDSNRFGTTFKKKFDELHSVLSSKYGKGKKRDVLIPGAMWDEPKYYMMALYKEERFLQWIQSDFSPENRWELESVVLNTAGLSPTRGKILLNYEFQGFEKFSKAKEDQENSGF